MPVLETLDVPLVVHVYHSELRGVVDPTQRYSGEGAPLLVVPHQLRYVHVGQRVAGDQDEGVVEPVGEALDATGRAEQLVLPLQVDAHAVYPRLLAVSLEERVRQVVDVDADFLDAVLRQKVEDVLDDRGVHHGGHGLGDLTRQRKEPGSLASRQSHRFHRYLPFCKACMGTLYSLSCTRALYTGSSPRPSSTNP
jgi:hypothetical protein